MIYVTVGQFACFVMRTAHSATQFGSMLVCVLIYELIVAFPYALCPVCYQNGQTALMMASNFGHTVIVQALIGAGVDVNLQNKVRYQRPRLF
jgi:hypothetical protein